LSGEVVVGVVEREAGLRLLLLLLLPLFIRIKRRKSHRAHSIGFLSLLKLLFGRLSPPHPPDHHER
jgi:hypothetical protein